MCRFLVLALLLAGCTTTTTGRRLDALFTDLHERGLFDGAVVVGIGEEIVWEKGFGFASREAGARFTPETAADGASLAKTMTAELVQMLESEGKLSLDEPVQRLLPELPYSGLTLRHLLSHSNGLPDYGWFDAFLKPDEVRTTEGLLAIVAREKPALLFAPGTAFEYSSFGFDLSALAAARAAGESFGALLQKRIFDPLGITSAFLRPARLKTFLASAPAATKAASRTRCSTTRPSTAARTSTSPRAIFIAGTPPSSASLFPRATHPLP